jgi:hypothetical protein
MHHHIMSMRTYLGIFIESFEQAAALVTWFGHGPETLGSSGFIENRRVAPVRTQGVYTQRCVISRKESGAIASVAARRSPPAGSAMTRTRTPPAHALPPSSMANRRPVPRNATLPVQQRRQWTPTQSASRRQTGSSSSSFSCLQRKRFNAFERLLGHPRPLGSGVRSLPASGASNARISSSANPCPRPPNEPEAPHASTRTLTGSLARTSAARTRQTSSICSPSGSVTV